MIFFSARWTMSLPQNYITQPFALACADYITHSRVWGGKVSLHLREKFPKSGTTTTTHVIRAQYNRNTHREETRNARRAIYLLPRAVNGSDSAVFAVPLGIPTTWRIYAWWHYCTRDFRKPKTTEKLSEFFSYKPKYYMYGVQHIENAKLCRFFILCYRDPTITFN